VTPAPEGLPHETLAEWHLFVDTVEQVPTPRLVPYDVNAELFADYAFKRRFIYVPEDVHIGYEATEKWRLPVGTILVKTFSYPFDARDLTKGERLLETRLLIHESAGWATHTYVWDSAQTTARLEPSGDILAVNFVDAAGNDVSSNYVVPTEDECRQCHGKAPATNTLGGRTRQLDRDHDYGNGPENQIDHFDLLGLFERAPEPASSRQRLVDPFGTAPIGERARAYLDGNCAHCHQPDDAFGSLSGLWMDYASTDPNNDSALHMGVCKKPTSAAGSTCGYLFDVVPGKPDESILICRLEATSPRMRMPPVGRTLVHEQGARLLRDWISTLTGSCGATPAPEAGAPDGGGDAGKADAATVDSASPSDASHPG
jgi:uncharacterized repeat protein (TIGR03806 family)